ncbi:MAG: hypothetical protein ACTH8F_03220, partial [Microbacterium sp.]|uniref:hypothetical protein n=1 Tax=Microbacterium sp. TaxID=51671 RepID=UPI003F9B69E3
DLTDQAADDDAALDLDDPIGYAEELRAAAGLPDRATAAKRAPLRIRVATRLGTLADRIRQSAFGAWMLDLLLALRPVWWVLRGFGMFAIVALPFGFINSGYGGWFLPENLWEWLVLLGLVLVSVQWGRDRWLPKNALRHMRIIVSVIAIIMLPVALGSVLSPRVEYVDGGGYQQPGLLLDGVQVGNVFAYDENGELIDSVQLYTDKGTPLNLFGKVVDGTGEDGWYSFGWNGDDPVRVPFDDARGSDIWNIYPLQEGKVDQNTGKVRESTVKDAAPPFLRAPGLLTPAPTLAPASTDAPVDNTDETPAP